MDKLTAYLEKMNLALNDQQKEAAGRVDGATLLLAVPGSGKTTVIICRLGYMIQALGIPPESILTLTFSRACARDLGVRYRYLLGGEGTAPRFSTIHSFALSVIRAYERRYQRRAFDVLEDPAAIIRELYRALFNTFPSDTDISDVLSGITYAKNMMLSSQEIEAMKVGDIDFPRIYNAYESTKREQHLMDFDDMLKYALTMLRRDKNLLGFFTDRYTYINIDEAQDTSKIQFELIHLLARARGNLFMVGDEDQSIYGFRGAWPKGLLEFKNLYPQGQVLLMEQNYRSTAALVAAAGRFITLNAERYEKKMVTVNPKGVVPVMDYVANLEEQYRFILNSVRKEGKDTAVLYRNNESAIPLVDLFERAGVPYRLKEHMPLFFSHFVVRDIRDFLALAADPSDFDVFERIYYKMNCGISKADMKRAAKRARSGESVFTALGRLPDAPAWRQQKLTAQAGGMARLAGLAAPRCVNFICYHLGYQQHLDYRIAHGYREEQLTQKLNILRTIAAREESQAAFLDRLDALEAMMRDTGGEGKQRRGAIFSTIHSSKGLEFEKVFMIDAVEGEFPAKAALEETEEGQRLFNEEVRLFYVGVTRAKRELEFLCVGRKDAPDPLRPVSRFIRYYMGQQTAAAVRAAAGSQKKTPGFSSLANKGIASHSRMMPKADLTGWKAGSILYHRAFGKGEIVTLDKEIASIRFEEAGSKKLNLAVCLSGGIVSDHPLDR